MPRPARFTLDALLDASAELLAPTCGQYVLISSIGRYADTATQGGDESHPAATMPNPRAEEMGEQFENYGPLKALCEEAAERAFPGRVTIVRPTYIVGPGDPLLLFTYWLVRVARAIGERREVLVPGTPDDPVQVIDVRPKHSVSRSKDIAEGAVWRDPERIQDWIGELSKSDPVVVYCVYGFWVSRDAVTALRTHGVDARVVGGGIAAWHAMGGKSVPKPTANNSIAGGHRP